MNADTRRLTLALMFGAVCHGSFAIGVGLMMYHLFFGLSHSWGAVPWPFAAFANLVLLLQFPVIHSLLLTGKGRELLALMGPDKRLSTTLFAMIAAIQLALLFAFWTPSGIILWQATGVAFWVMCALYAASWGFLMLAIMQSGFQLQSGMLGWFAMARGRDPKFPDMPTHGLYRIIRQPIYAGFAMTLWTMPTYTPDQLVLAVVWTGYCVIGPLHKEKRFTNIYGDRFRNFQKRVPYWLPFPRKSQDDKA
ncbi:isoprenylcysteine carboxylmethyltransferase family protein [Loktanella sp. TSTF-M6]|uniref:Isoprenylcysteine carboxylmethyltransferase family protein n=1 Tax=Loktanella gaetbuli TaxID=2881335 RepID=A0ABS8BVF3_9RHOB|nr:isoprenylcysteine carboxylmethyltransferase family protein [Loktanella gaetbuli]MCB5199690.1 isoprenylcysteine carboxylmethyltransferase family protein [Loktanella gaetbuli]